MSIPGWSDPCQTRIGGYDEPVIGGNTNFMVRKDRYNHWKVIMPTKSAGRPVRESLDKTFSAINELWDRAEQALRKFHIPGKVSITYGSEIYCGHPYSKMLGYIYFDGEWKICHAIEEDDLVDDRDEGPQWKPIKECRAEVRVEAAAHLQDLHGKVIEEAVAFTERARTAEKQLAQTIEMMEL